MSTKKSDFVSTSTVDDASFFDMVVNGTNLKIPKADLITALGMTGSLSQVGSVTGTPVLDAAASADKLIRNLESGSGVKASVSPENGITLEHNFTFDDTGAPLTPDSSATSPTIRSLVAGSGVSVGASGDIIQIALSAVPASTKTVVINQISDFPTAVVGVIPLAANTDYLLTNDMSTSLSFYVPAL